MDGGGAAALVDDGQRDGVAGLADAGLAQIGLERVAVGQVALDDPLAEPRSGEEQGKKRKLRNAAQDQPLVRLKDSHHLKNNDLVHLLQTQFDNV